MIRPLTAGVCVLLFASALYASGTTNLPRNFFVRGKKVSRANLLRGRKLFSGKQLVGEGGKACGECHDKRNKLKTKSLNKQIKMLPALINKCLIHEERTRGKKLKPNSKEMRALEAWIIYRYRCKLPKR